MLSAGLLLGKDWPTEQLRQGSEGLLPVTHCFCPLSRMGNFVKLLKYAALPSALLVASSLAVVPTAGAQLSTYAYGSAYEDAAELGRNNVIHDQETIKALAPTARGGERDSQGWG